MQLGKYLQKFNFLLDQNKLNIYFNKLNQFLWLGFWLGLVIGLVWGLFIVPADFKQGDAFRIMYIHVPAAILSLQIYVFMGVCALIYLVFRIKLYGKILIASSSLGAGFTLIALITGAIWGQPMWGTWWAWDARLTSELILLFIYLGIIALNYSQQNLVIIAIFCLIGLVDIPIVHFSVEWWQTLHQGPTITNITTLAKPSIDLVMLPPLGLLYFSLICYYIAILGIKLKNA